MPAKVKPFKNESFKKKRFKQIPVSVGTIYYDYINAKPGYYNSRKVTFIAFDTVKIVNVNFQNDPVSSEYEESLKNAQACKNKADRLQHIKNETIREIEHNLLCKLSFEKYIGGAIVFPHIFTELKDILDKFKKETLDLKVPDSSVPAGGFSGANSSTMRSSRAGTPINISTNGVHRGGYWGFNTNYLIQIQVGGGIQYEIHKALLNVARRILSKCEFSSNLGHAGIKNTDGTNWSSVMLTAPTANNQYTTMPRLNELI